MIDALWIATSGTAYARENRTLERADEFLFDFYISRHPYDDEPYVADIQIIGSGWRHTDSRVAEPRCSTCGSWVKSHLDTRHAVCSDSWHATDQWCPSSEDNIHCNHWFDCQSCCRCGYDGGGEDCDCPRHSGTDVVPEQIDGSVAGESFGLGPDQPGSLGSPGADRNDGPDGG